MNKLILLIAALSILTLPGCKKCISCEVKDSQGNVIDSGSETCGSDAEVEKEKDRAANKSGLIGGSYICIDS